MYVFNGRERVTGTWTGTHGVVPCTLQAMDKAAVGSMRLSQGDPRESVNCNTSTSGLLSEERCPCVSHLQYLMYRRTCIVSAFFVKVNCMTGGFNVNLDRRLVTYIKDGSH